MSTVSGPWAARADVDAYLEGSDSPPERSDEQWTALLLEASEALYQLSGRQYRGVGQSKVQIVRAAGGSPDCPLLPGWVPWWPAEAPTALPLYGIDTRWGREQTAVVTLPSSPVVQVDEVTIDGQVLDPASYWCTAGGQLERTDGWWPLDGTLLIRFTHGQPPPAGGKAAAIALAVEFARADIGQENGLPQRIRTLSREGVTATLKDDTATEDLDRWRTGVPRADQWLATVNPHRMTRRARCSIPGQPRARRVTT